MNILKYIIAFEFLKVVLILSHASIAVFQN